MNQLMAGHNSSRVRNNVVRAVVTAIGVATLALSASAASASSTDYFGSPTMRVDFQDLDLTKQADTKRLYSRLRLAASQVCIGYPSQSRLLRSSARAKCETRALTTAVEAIAHPALTALHSANPQMKFAQRGAKSSSNS